MGKADCYFFLVRNEEVKRALLTEVQSHSTKDDETKPGVEGSHKINDGNGDIGNGRKNVENHVTGDNERKHDTDELEITHIK